MGRGPGNLGAIAELAPSLIDPQQLDGYSLQTRVTRPRSRLIHASANRRAGNLAAKRDRFDEAVPLLDSPQIGSLAEGAQVAFSGIFGAAIMICAPVLLALIITDAALGVVSRVVPQINVFAVGFPAKIAVGLLLVGASLPFVAGWISDELQQSVATALRTLKVA